MRFLRWAGSFFLIITVLASSLTCAGPSSQKNHPILIPPHNECRRTYGYDIDREFSKKQTELIDQAIYEWQEGSGRTVCFILTPGGIKIRRAHNPVIEKRIAEIGSKSNGAPASNILGLADFPDGWILTERIYTDHDMYAVSIHEIGHLIGLEHYDPKDVYGKPIIVEPSWMYPSIDRVPRGDMSLTAHDIRELIRIENRKTFNVISN